MQLLFLNSEFNLSKPPIKQERKTSAAITSATRVDVASAVSASIGSPPVASTLSPARISDILSLLEFYYEYSNLTQYRPEEGGRGNNHAHYLVLNYDDKRPELMFNERTFADTYGLLLEQHDSAEHILLFSGRADNVKMAHSQLPRIHQEFGLKGFRAVST